MTSTYDATFSRLVADLLLGQMQTPTTQIHSPEQNAYRRAIFRTIRDYTGAIQTYNRNIESLIQLLGPTTTSDYTETSGYDDVALPNEPIARPNEPIPEPARPNEPSIPTRTEYNTIRDLHLWTFKTPIF